jgi:exopolysaccharide biosynthesis polyprenyl glycosylphosphotransferase
MLVGPADEIKAMAAGVTAESAGVRVAATAVVPTPLDEQGQEVGTALGEALADAVAKARALKVDDVVILTDWARAEHIHQIADAFTQLPVAIHLGASSVLGRFTDARVSRFAALTALSLTEPPLGPLQALAKRVFDVLVSGAALSFLAPLFLAVAVLIKLSSPGPVFFRQHRRGFNHEEFRIWKFRTMTTLDDGEEIVQARPADSRVTWIGRYLRRYSIDELPQLINVLKGEMSLVGPRPHAVAHDRLFEKRIVSYPRRLNVRPGITGWAQVHGLRGATETDDLMTRRVEHDLYYIDNWSIVLDLYIMALTVLSPKAYRNAH